MGVPRPLAMNIEGGREHKVKECNSAKVGGAHQ